LVCNHRCSGKCGDCLKNGFHASVSVENFFYVSTNVRPNEVIVLKMDAILLVNLNARRYLAVVINVLRNVLNV
jgi:hypothetical protein